ncbi:RnfABCDGE type electron transport complex subunit D [Bacteroidia bacterium]|nr:RnfABCDGE type electron transport complex subunit D [Bacteroidia bacterium]MDC1395441.1 RnfABCDGE type electron transport complex subunit D [Bacteroidia bacterium]
MVVVLTTSMIRKALTIFSEEAKDPRYFQILYLCSFLLYGITYLGWESDTAKYIWIFASAVFTQLVFSHFTTKRYSSIKSALITAVGLCLLLKTGSIQVAVFASVVAIATKFLIKVKNKHIFNPANIGIIAAIIFTNEAWVSPGQWGSDVLLWFLVGAAGLMMILKVGRIDTSITFLLAFGGLLFFRQVVYLGWEPSVWLHKMSNGTLLLFTFFMITDPMTTPNHKHARILWSTILALALFVASSFFYVQTAAIWILFALSPFTPIFDKLFKSEKYEWNTVSKSKIEHSTI